MRSLSVAKATLQSQMSVCLSVSPLPKPLSLSELLLSTIEPINHHAYRPSSLSTIKPINFSSSFATFKPFGLFFWRLPLTLLYGLKVDYPNSFYEILMKSSPTLIIPDKWQIDWWAAFYFDKLFWSLIELIRIDNIHCSAKNKLSLFNCKS